MVDPASYNLQPTFPIAGVADIIAQRPYREAQMRATQQEQLVKGLQGFGEGVNSLVQRRIAMAQALATGQFLKGILGQGGATGAAPSSPALAPSGAAPPTLSTGTAPSPASDTGSVPRGTVPPTGGIPPPGGLPLGIMTPPPSLVPPSAPAAQTPVPMAMPPLTAGSAPPAPPAPLAQAPTPGVGMNLDANTLGQMAYGRDPAELLKSLLPYMQAGQERQVQLRQQQVDVYKTQMENLKQANTDAINLAKAQLEAKVKNREIDTNEANSYRTLLGSLEQKQTELIKESPGKLNTILAGKLFGSGARALDELKTVSEEIKNVQGRLGMAVGGAGALPSLGQSIKHPSGATIRRIK